MTHRSRAPKQPSWSFIRSRFRMRRAAADELFMLMDDVVAGRGREQSPEHVAPETLATARETQESLVHGVAHLDASRRHRMWEEIMSSTSTGASLPLPAPLGRGRAPRKARRRVAHAPGRPVFPAARPFVNIAFAVVLLVAIIGGAKGWMSGRNGGAPTPRHQLAAPMNPAHPLATPSGTPGTCTANCDYAFDAPPVFPVAQATITKQKLASADLDARRVQLLDWQVAPGVSVAMPADDDGGVIVDTVLDGAAAMAIDGPATIVRQNDPLRGFYEYPEAGETVELARGDTIVYSATHMRTVANPLSLITLHLKSAVFFNGDAARFQPPADTAGVTVKVNGERTMAHSLSIIEGPGFSFVLNYIQMYPGRELPEQRSRLTRVLGPVDALAGPAGTEGFVIWIGPVKG